MIVLALDTSTPATVVGLACADGHVLEARDDPPPGERPGHATRLLPLAAGLLSEAGIGWPDVERIAVGVGPGTFTGLRIGVASARGLAQSIGCPLVGVSSLRALAHGCHEDAVLAAIDARRGEVFLAAYLGERQLLAPRAVKPEAVADAVAEIGADAVAEIGADTAAEIDADVERWLAVGDGAVLYRDAFDLPAVAVPDDSSPLHRIQARALCELGALATPNGAQVLPDYLRRPDAALALEGSSRALEGSRR